jgi:hypothetical protein
MFNKNKYLSIGQTDQPAGKRGHVSYHPKNSKYENQYQDHIKLCFIRPQPDENSITIWHSIQGVILKHKADLVKQLAAEQASQVCIKERLRDSW